MATVRPLRVAATPPVVSAQREPVRPVRPPAGNTPSLPADEKAAFAQALNFPQRVRTPPAARVAAPAPPTRAERQAQNTLDASWDRRLGRGLVSPDSSVDLHGHTLASAHALLDQGLDRAIRRGDRVLLLVTGKPPRPESERPHARGAIRAAVADWLAASRFNDRIAAVRGAHPRHGGTGALYIVLRRPRGG